MKAKLFILLLLLMVIVIGLFPTPRRIIGLASGVPDSTVSKQSDQLPKELFIDGSVISDLAGSKGMLPGIIPNFPVNGVDAITLPTSLVSESCNVLINDKKKVPCSRLNIRTFSLELASGRGLLTIHELSDGQYRVSATVIMGETLYSIPPAVIGVSDKLVLTRASIDTLKEASLLLQKSEMDSDLDNKAEEVSDSEGTASSTNSTSDSNDSKELSLGSITQALEASGSSLVEAPIYIETDFELYQRLSDMNVDAAENIPTILQHILHLMGSVNIIYKDNINLAFKIVGTSVYTTTRDPWSGGTPRSALSNLRAVWQQLLQRPQAPEVAFVHLFSGKFGGGRAYINRNVCSFIMFGTSGIQSTAGRAINDILQATADQANKVDIIIIAHELGHNFNSKHTFDYRPPIDCCSLEGDRYQRCIETVYGDENLNVDIEALEYAESHAPIMSYCPKFIPDFSVRERQVLHAQRDRGENRGCFERVRNTDPIIDDVVHPSSVLGGERGEIVVRAHDLDGDPVYYILENLNRVDFRAVSLDGRFAIPRAPVSLIPYLYRVTVYDQRGAKASFDFTIAHLPNLTIELLPDRYAQPGGFEPGYEYHAALRVGIGRNDPIDRPMRIAVDFGDGLGTYHYEYPAQSREYIRIKRRYRAAGLYQLHAAVENDYGRTWEAEIPVEIVPFRDPNMSNPSTTGYLVVGAPIRVNATMNLMQNYFDRATIDFSQIQYRLDYGDGSADTGPFPSGLERNRLEISHLHHYRHPGRYTISLSCSTLFGPCSTLRTFNVEIEDQVVLIDGVSIPRNITVGQAANMIFSFSNPSDEPLVFNISWGDSPRISQYQIAPGAQERRRGLEASHTYLRAGTFPLEINVLLNGEPATTYSAQVVVQGAPIKGGSPILIR